MAMNGKKAVNEKKCSVCMYYKNKIYCIRKKQETEGDDYCLHFVKVYERHSYIKIIDQLAALLSGDVQ